MAKSEVAVASTPGLVSIVVPCCGMLEYTKLCVPSILKHTRAPFELIFLDIGSLDGTVEYLAGLQAGLLPSPTGRGVGGEGVRVHVERAPTDLGLKDACQRALDQARGEYVCLLNNDCIVTNGWLNQLIGLATFSVTIGLVGPMSNMAAEAQLVDVVPYRTSPSPRMSAANQGGLIDVSAVDRFALEFRKEQQGNWMYAERLGGFCLLVKREVLDKVGSKLHEWTDLSLFDSDILSSKAKEAGYSLAVCRDLFVHHFGTRMFAHSAKPSIAPENSVTV
jgi:GT2 family glycosyltransferase